MKPLKRVALIGNHLPRRCGIATFTHDLHRSISTAHPGLETCVVAMNDPGATYDYPAAVRFQIPEETIDAYADAADFLNTERFDVVSLQHEYGIFGDEAGGHIVELLNRLSMPIVTTLHTVLPAPTPVQHKVMGKIRGKRAIRLSSPHPWTCRGAHRTPAALRTIRDGRAEPSHPSAAGDRARVGRSRGCG